ncbi:50S ribosomal protein L11 methyltransferase [Lentibacillus cibarius]|uniref:Ribosomal protein L11 methyltransferase n=1 Tax=Lentibacillus cibarius TaxID=2583219 RepID=A0A5S3QP63_9BACI|nr:50S ribosomal protein L11 methyltransferase [Lentibacillus cibarius]TMN23752.1 50S ribosomal protein L11 methyltransferase [Lentibacillus cibarius]
MKWSEFCIHTTNEAVEPISNILHETGASGVVIEDPLDLMKDRDTFFGEVYELNPDDYPEDGVYIKAYLPVNSHLGETVDAMKQAINNLQLYDIDLGRNQVTVSEINEEEWATAWKKYYKPVEISEKITIIPTWETYEPASDNEVIIELDPGMAFGTGTHPTTVQTIQAIEQYINNQDVVIDVGCGSGVLSIASGLLGASEVHAFDLDDVAVKSTTINAKLNNMHERITVKQNHLLSHVSMQADMIVANILAEIIIQFVGDAWKNLKPGGIFITSGIIRTKQQMVQEKLQEVGFRILDVNELQDWVSITAKKI